MTKLLIAATILFLLTNCSGSTKPNLVDIIIVNSKGDILIDGEEYKNVDSLRLSISEELNFSVIAEHFDMYDATILPYSAYRQDKKGVGKFYVTLLTDKLYREKKESERLILLSDYTVKINTDDSFVFQNQEKFNETADKWHGNGKNEMLRTLRYAEVKKALSSYSVSEYLNYNAVMGSYAKKEYFGSPEDLELELVIDHVRIFSVEKGAFTLQFYGKWKLYDNYSRVLYSHPIRCYASIYNFEPNMIHGDYGLSLNEGITNPVQKCIQASFYDFLDADKTQFYLNKKNPLYKETAKWNKTLPAIKLQNSNALKSNRSLEDNLNSTVMITDESKSSFGSGSIISNNGYILTNYHVVEEIDKIIVTLNNGKEKTARLIRCDKQLDVALIKIDCDSCEPIPISTAENYRLGEPIYDIGTPSNVVHQNSVFSGIISGIRTIYLGKYIQSNALGGGGMSGGPLLNARGQQIGIRVWGIIDEDGKLVSGFSFYIPVTRALEALNISL